MKILANTTDKIIKEKTGKTWDEWLNILDRDNAISMNHTKLFTHIHNKYKIDQWWTQKISVGYEHERGLRQQYEKCDDEFEISKSKIFNIELSQMFQIIHKFIENSFFGNIEITTLNKNKNIRGKMDDNTSFSFDFYPKENKTQLVIQHFKLNDSKHGEEKKNFWTSKLKEIETEIF